MNFSQFTFCFYLQNGVFLIKVRIFHIKLINVISVLQFHCFGQVFVVFSERVFETLKFKTLLLFDILIETFQEVYNSIFVDDLFLDRFDEKLGDNISEFETPSTFFRRRSDTPIILLELRVLVVLTGWVAKFSRATFRIGESLLIFTFSLDGTLFEFLAFSQVWESITSLNFASEIFFILVSVTDSETKRSVFHTRVL